MIKLTDPKFVEKYCSDANDVRLEDGKLTFVHIEPYIDEYVWITPIRPLTEKEIEEWEKLFS